MSRFDAKRVEKKTTPAAKPVKSNGKPTKAVVSSPINSKEPRIGGDGGVYKVIHRTKLKDAPYNPRTIDDVAFKRLKESVKRTKGLIQPPVWNVQTGHIVAGHQRLKALDAYKGTSNYEVTVIEINVPIGREIEMNISLNSPLLSGEYDVELLDDLLQKPDVEFDRAGIDLTYLESLHLDAGMDLPDWLMAPEDRDADQALQDEGMEDDISEAMDEADLAEQAEQEAEEIAEIKRRKESFKEQEAFTHQTGVSFRVVCPSDRTCAELLKQLGNATVKAGSGDYIDGMLLADRLGIKERLEEILDEERPKKKSKKPKSSQD